MVEHVLLEPLLHDLRRWEGLSATLTLEDTDRAFDQLPKYARVRYQLVNGTLWAGPSRCVHRRDETTAWALLQMIERYPAQPDFDIVLNCRDGPLRFRPRKRRRLDPKAMTMAHTPIVLSYSTTRQHQEIAFPDYTLWGLPGKLKPWAQLRLDLLHRAAVPLHARRPQIFATGIVNSYHASLGVRTREQLQKCPADHRLSLHFHRLYFERFYSTEEHCAYKYILLAPGSHAIWLDHMKQVWARIPRPHHAATSRGHIPPPHPATPSRVAMPDSRHHIPHRHPATEDAVWLRSVSLRARKCKP
jgi:hypothetical protein